jgi:alkylhydroperoxidase family enzyme
MLNGCVFCLDMQSRDAGKLGEIERRIYLLAAWRETDLGSEQERAALALTDAMTLLPAPRDPGRARGGLRTGSERLHRDQYRAVAWTITVINAFNPLGVTSAEAAA